MLNVLTFLNVSDTPWKVVVVYFNCMIVVTGLTLLFIFRYMTKYRTFESAKVTNHKEQTKLNDASASKDFQEDPLDNQPASASSAGPFMPKIGNKVRRLTATLGPLISQHHKS